MNLNELRRQFAEAFSLDFDLVRDEVREKDGAPYWLAHARAKRSGEFVFRHLFETPHYGYRYHDDEMRVFVSESGCRREVRDDLRPQPFCVGDTVIIPILVADRVVDHTFRNVSRFPRYYSSPFRSELGAALSVSEESPAGVPFLRTIGREMHHSVHRGLNRTSLHFQVFFEALEVGRFDLELSPRLPVALAGHSGPGSAVRRSIVIVPRGAPIAELVAEESVYETDEKSENPRVSSSGGTSYPVSVLMLRPGDRFSLTYGEMVVPATEETLEAAREVTPAIQGRPFSLDTVSGYTAWLPSPSYDPAEGPYLRWSFVARSMPDGSGSWYHPDSVSWVDRNEVSWETCLPERMRRVQAGIGDAEVEAYRSYPRQTHAFPFLVGVLDIGPAVVIADATGLLALDRSDGSVLLDFDASRPDRDGAERLWFDAGSYAITSSTGRTTGPVKGGRFLADAGTRLVYFNGSTLAVFSKEGLRPLGRVHYESATHDRVRKPGRVAARIPLLDLDVALDGVIHLR